MTQQLPERANLEQLKKQAKSLLHAARAQDPAALERFRAIPALSGSCNPQSVALHDAQFVIAREYGFKSWNDLREYVEERALSFDAAVDEFVRSATGDAQARALRLLALHPGIARANLFTELVLGDAAAVETRLKAHPDAALQSGGPQNWEPLLYVCHTCLHRESPERAAGLVKIARGLLRHGADPNAEYHWNWHRELPRTALWGALVAMGHLPLAEVLLEAGANPTDGVSTHIAAGAGHLPALELLQRFGLNVNGIPGGVPPLRYIMSWHWNSEGVRWLLEHGADPNLAWAEHGDAPLHIAAERSDVEMVDLLVSHGADIHQRRSDGRTPHTIASLYGNQEIAAWLLQHGATDELTPFERFVSACARGDRSRAGEMLAEHPELRIELRAEHHRMLHVPAERGDTKVLETMLACGFDPNTPDHDGVTPLHRAAMAGKPEAVRVLLAGGAPVNALDGMFAGTPLVWACEGWSHARSGADHLGVARVLLAAGSSREWTPPEKAPSPERTQELLADLCRAAEAA
ncbi:MAG TPA: ankyrin repeat domain-containing protein [Bryobacteraceae bacterium]|jgi:ankyrin repeat protein